MKRTHKYGAVATTVNGIKFASKAEAKRWGELKLLERAGAISTLERQKRFPLHVNGQLICHYVADFDYVDNASGHFVTEDVKGIVTQVFVLKRKLMKAVHGIDIVEIGGRKPRAKVGDWIARKVSMRSAA